MGIFDTAVDDAPATGIFGTAAPTAGVFGGTAFAGLAEGEAVTYTPGALGEEPVQNYQTSLLGQRKNAELAALMMAAGVPLDTDPSLVDQATGKLRTPEDAHLETQQSLVKLAVANPDLAQELAGRLEGREEDQSFFEHLKDFAGDVFAPVAAIGGKALDLLSRSSHIVPELFRNDDDDPWTEDIAEAMSGKSTATWAKVLRDRFGWEDNIVTGAVGFVGDVLTDPLTWLTFGTGGAMQVTAKASGQLVGKTMLKELAEQHAIKTGTKVLDDDMLEKAYHSFTSQLQGHVARGGRLSGDASFASFVNGVSEVPEDMLRQAFTLANTTTEVLQKTGRLRQGLLAQGVPPERVNTIVQALTQAGKGSGRQARNLAGATRGIRVRGGIPFTDLKWTSGAIPGTQRFGFDIPRNFFRGFWGHNRLQRAVIGGLEGATPEHLAIFERAGIKGLMAENPALARYVSGGVASHLGQPLYSLSHRVGKITAHMSRASQVYRGGGLVGLYAYNAGRDAKAIRSSVIEAASTIRNDDGTIAAAPRAYEQALRTLKSDPDSVGRYNAWARGEEATLNPHEEKALDFLFRGVDQTSDMLETYGIVPPTRNTTREFASELNDADMDVWQKPSRLGQNTTLYMKSAPATEGQEAVEGLGFGYRVVGEGQPGGTVPVAIRTVDPYVIREGVVSDADPVAAIYNGIYQDLDNQRDALMRIHGLNDEQWLAYRQRKAAEAFTARALKDGKDAVVRMDENDNIIEAVVFHHNDQLRGPNVKVRDASTPQVSADARSSLPMMLSKRYREARWGPDVNKHKLFVHELPEEEAVLLQRAATDGDRADILAKSLKDDLDFDPFERDLRVIAADYSGWAGNEIAKRHLAMSGRKLRGMVGTEGVGGAVTSSVWQTRGTTISEEFTKEFDDTVKRAIARHGIAEEHADNLINIWAKDAAEQKGAIDNLITSYVGDVDELVRLGQTRVQRVGDEYVRIKASMKKLRQEKANARKVQQELKALRKQRSVFIDDLDELKLLKEQLDEAQAILRRQAGTFGHAGAIIGGQGVGGAGSATNLAKKSGPKKSVFELAAEARLREINERLEEIGVGVGVTGRTSRYIALDSAIRQTEAAKATEETFTEMLGKGRTVDEIEAEMETLATQREALATALAKDKPLPKGISPEVDELRKYETAAKKRFRAIQRRRHKIESAIEEANKIRGRYRSEAQAIPRPALVETAQGVPPGYDEIRGIPGMEGLAAHPYIASELRNALKGNNISEMRRAYREWLQGPWKRWATIYYPGFHARNHIGAWFNNWLGGTTAKDYTISHKISRALKGDTDYSIGGKKQYIPEKDVNEMGIRYMFDDPKQATWEELGWRIHEMGVRGSNSQGFADIYNNLTELKKMSAAGDREGIRMLRTTIGKPFHYAGRGARAATELTENFHRQAAFVRGLKHTGGDLANARMFTFMRQGDYEDLNDFEEVAKDFIPFYKWMRTNFPFQLHSLLHAPGKQLSVLKAKDAAYTMQGMDPHEERRKQPHYIADAFTIPLPFGADGEEAVTMAVLDLPMADLHQGANDFLSSMLPLLKPAFESGIIKKNMFTKQELKGRMVPLAGWAKMPGIKQILDATGWVQYNTEGEPMIRDTTQNMMSMIPVFSRFRNWVFSDPRSMTKRSGALMSMMTGVRLQQQGDTELITAERAFLEEEVKPILDTYEELGIKFPAIDEVDPSVWAYLGFEMPVDEEAPPQPLTFAQPQ